MTFARGFRVGSDEGRYYYDNQDQYISEEEYDTPIIQRRVSTEFPCRRPIDTTSVTTAMGANECDYWKSRCLGMQIACDDTQDKLREAEEDQRQMRQRIRELEEQLLLQSCNGTKDETPTNRDGGTDSSVEGTNKNKNINNNQAAQQGNEGMNCEFDEKKWVPPALVVEIKENYQAVSSCFYLTDGEGLNESYDLEMEDEEGISMDVNVCDNMLDDIDDDRNDINMNQRRG